MLPGALLANNRWACFLSGRGRQELDQLLFHTVRRLRTEPRRIGKHRYIAGMTDCTYMAEAGGEANEDDTA